jgi:hypothetical protein
LCPAELAEVGVIQPAADVEVTPHTSMIARLIILCLMFAFVGAARNTQTPQGCRHEFVPQDTVIALAERGCLIKITADGTVAFEGQTFDFDIARLKTRVNAEELRKLICEFERINYFSLKDRYRVEADGCPELGFPEVDYIISTSITLNGRSKSVTRHSYSCLDRDGFGFPRELVELEKSIKNVVDLKER